MSSRVALPNATVMPTEKKRTREKSIFNVCFITVYSNLVILGKLIIITSCATGVEAHIVFYGYMITHQKD